MVCSPCFWRHRGRDGRTARAAIHSGFGLFTLLRLLDFATLVVSARMFVREDLKCLDAFNRAL